MINVMHLNHPETIPHPRVHGKIICYETGCWSQTSWGALVRHGYHCVWISKTLVTLIFNAFRIYIDFFQKMNHLDQAVL